MRGAIAEGERHADGHGFAVQQIRRVAIGGLERMTECVPEIEQGSDARLTLVFGHDGSFRTATGRHSMGDRSRVQRQDRLAMLFEPGKKVRIIDQAVFHDFRISRAKLACRQGFQQGCICDHQLGLVKGANRVLAARRVHRGFAADRGIDLGQQGRRHLHEFHAALHQAGRETGNITNHAATERNEYIAAVSRGFEQPVQDAFEIGKGFRLLAGRQGFP